MKQRQGGFTVAQAAPSGPLRPPTAQEIASFQQSTMAQPTADAYSFIQLADFIAVIDARKQELYSDKRVRLGAPICRDGDVVTSITLANGWFDVVTASRTYRIPVTNVRSAVR